MMATAEPKVEEKKVHTAKLEATTGPNRRVKFDLEDITQVTFQLTKHVLEVARKDSTVTHYDLATTESVEASFKDGFFSFTLKTKEQEPEVEPVVEEPKKDVKKPALSVDAPPAPYNKK